MNNFIIATIAFCFLVLTGDLLYLNHKVDQLHEVQMAKDLAMYSFIKDQQERIDELMVFAHSAADAINDLNERVPDHSEESQ